MDQDGANLQEFMIERNLAKSAFLAGFLTHGHSDHIGGYNIFDDLPIYAGLGDQPVILGKRRSQGLLPGILDLIPGYQGAKMEGLNLIIVTDGQVIEIGNLIIRAFTLEGHTDGSMGYLFDHKDTGEHVFYAGDAIDHKRNGEIKAPPKIFSANKKASYKSIQAATNKIIDLEIEPDAVVTSHSKHGDFAAMKRYSHMESSKLVAKS
jgi:glyoxylase-like metal-dependent hydrolase (beta-lactamase superfamily II)